MLCLQEFSGTDILHAKIEAGLVSSAIRRGYIKKARRLSIEELGNPWPRKSIN